MKLLKIGEPLRGRLKAWLLTVHSFAKELFCADLLGSFAGISKSISWQTVERVLPGALFLTLGGPLETSIII